jgi:hypothetical protein
LGLALAIAAITALAAAAQAGAYVYWGELTGGSIGRAANDGSHIETEFIKGIGRPRSIAIDQGHIYWYDEETKRIGRAGIDGTGVEPKFINVGTGVSGIAVNGSYIFWAEGIADEIGRANLDSSSPNPSLVAAASPCGVAADANHVYWVTQGGPPSYIGRATVGGLSPEEHFVTIAGQGLPCGPAVDSLSIFWGDLGLGNGTHIGRADVSNGGSPDPTFIEGVSGPCGLTVFESRLYWANVGTGTIGRAVVNGNEPDQSFIHTGNKSTCGIAVDGLAPPPEPPPGGGAGGGGATDKTPPQTKIKSGPGKKLAQGKAKFALSSSEPGSSFTCKLDKKKASACRSPKSYAGLKPGSHTFKAWATDAAGNKDPTPAKRSFRVPAA